MFWVRVCFWNGPLALVSAHTHLPVRFRMKFQFILEPLQMQGRFRGFMPLCKSGFVVPPKPDKDQKQRTCLGAKGLIPTPPNSGLVGVKTEPLPLPSEVHVKADFQLADINTKNKNFHVWRILAISWIYTWL